MYVCILIYVYMHAEHIYKNLQTTILNTLTLSIHLCVGFVRVLRHFRQLEVISILSLNVRFYAINRRRVQVYHVVTMDA